MITHIPFNSLGKADHGWLKANFHFSFAHYYNPSRMGFGAIRVINDDRILPGHGFDMHPHDNMEIITYVRTGAITHKDNQGNSGRTTAGNVQIMSAGSGIIHSEYNLEDEDTTLYQIWITPNKQNIEPRWDSHQFDKVARTDALPLLVSGDGNAALSIHQDAAIYAGTLATNSNISHPILKQAYLLVSEGEVQVDGYTAKKGDGLEITEQTQINIHTTSQAEILIIDVPG